MWNKQNFANIAYPEMAEQLSAVNDVTKVTVSQRPSILHGDLLLGTIWLYKCIYKVYFTLTMNYQVPWLLLMYTLT